MPLRDTLRNLRSNNTAVLTLNIHSLEISVEDTQQVVQALKTNTSLNSFRTDSNYLGDEGAKTFAEVLTVHRGLRKVALWGAKIGSIGAKHLAKSLLSNLFLNELTLGMNPIFAKGAHYFAKALRVNTHLTELNLYQNQMGDEGAIYLAKSLCRSQKRRYNRSLITLNLGNNQISNIGATKLAKALKKNYALTQLILDGNPIDEVIRMRINQLLLRNLKARNEFLLAAEQGDIGKVTYLHRKGVSIHASRTNGMTALHLAARNGHFHVFTFLVENGGVDTTLNFDKKNCMELYFHYRSSLSKPTTPTGSSQRESPKTPTSNTVRYLAQCWEERTQQTLRNIRTTAPIVPEIGNISIAPR